MAASGRRLRLPVLLLVALALLGGVAAPVTALPSARSPTAHPAAVRLPRAGAADGPRVTVALDDVTPEVARPGDDVTVTATITNDGSTAVAQPEVRLVLGEADLVRRSDVEDWADATGPATGRVLTGSRLPTPLPPGESRTVRLTVSDLTGVVDAPYGALPVSVESGGASVRTFLGFQRRKEYVPLRTTWVLPLTLDGTAALFEPQGKARAEAWSALEDPGSRLSRVLQAGRGHDVTWALDPTLVTPPGQGTGAGDGRTGDGQTPSSGGSQGSPDSPSSDSPGSPDSPGADGSASAGTSGPPGAPGATTGSGGSSGATGTPTSTNPDDPAVIEAAARRDVADRVRTAVAGTRPIVLPEADADLSAAYDSARVAAAVRTRVGAARPTATELDGRAGVAWPVTAPTTVVERNRLAGLYPGTGPRAVLVPGSGLAASSFTPEAGQRSPEGVPELAWDDELSSLTTRTGTPQAAALSAQQLVAESATLLDERPGTARGVLIAAPRTVDPDPGGLSRLIGTAESIPWMSPGSLKGLLADARKAVPQSVGPEAVPSASGTATTPPPLGLGGKPLLTGDIASRIHRDRDVVASVGTIRDDGEDWTAQWTRVADQLTSVRWRDSPGGWHTLARQLHATASRAEDAVTVSSGAINFFAESGRLQLTAVNHLDVGVHDVRIRLVPGNPRLRLDTQPEPIRLGPGGRGSVNVQATALAAGKVPVTVHVLSADGTRIGSPAVLSVRVSPTGDWIYWGVGGVAALLLVLGLWRTLRSGRRGPLVRTPAEDHARP